MIDDVCRTILHAKFEYGYRTKSRQHLASLAKFDVYVTICCKPDI